MGTVNTRSASTDTASTFTASVGTTSSYATAGRFSETTNDDCYNVSQNINSEERRVLKRKRVKENKINEERNACDADESEEVGEDKLGTREA